MSSYLTYQYYIIIKRHIKGSIGIMRDMAGMESSYVSPCHNIYAHEAKLASAATGLAFNRWTVCRDNPTSLAISLTPLPVATKF